MAIKHALFWFGLVVLVGMFSFAPASRATSAGDAASSYGAGIDSNPIDCTNGCTIITCGKITCTVWYCNAQGCVIKGSYGNPNVVETNSANSAGVPTIPKRDGLAFAKVCSGEACQLYELTTDKATKIGLVDDVGAIIRKLRAEYDASHQ